MRPELGSGVPTPPAGSGHGIGFHVRSLRQDSALRARRAEGGVGKLDSQLRAPDDGLRIPEQGFRTIDHGARTTDDEPYRMDSPPLVLLSGPRAMAAPHLLWTEDFGRGLGLARADHEPGPGTGHHEARTADGRVWAQGRGRGRGRLKAGGAGRCGGEWRSAGSTGVEVCGLNVARRQRALADLRVCLRVRVLVEGDQKLEVGNWMAGPQAGSRVEGRVPGSRKPGDGQRGTGGGSRVPCPGSRIAGCRLREQPSRRVLAFDADSASPHPVLASSA
jgi:hypothetical protein